MRNVLGWDAVAGVADVHLYHTVVTREPQANLALIGVFTGVVEQVGDDFAQPVGVYLGIVQGADYLIGTAELHGRAGIDDSVADNGIIADDEINPQVLLLGREVQIAGKLLHKAAQLDNFWVVGEAAILCFGAGKEVLEQFSQVLGAGVSLFQVVFGAAVDGGDFVVERQAQVTLDGSDGRAHLMAGGADEFGTLALGLALFAYISKDSHQAGDLVVGNDGADTEAGGDGYIGFADDVGIVITHRLAAFKCPGKWRFGFIYGFALGVYECKHRFPIESLGIFAGPAGNAGCAGVEQSYNPLLIYERYTIFDAVEDDVALGFLVAQGRGQLTGTGGVFALAMPECRPPNYATDYCGCQ